MSTTVTEYVCPDCGTLLRHSNPTTLESMRDVHNQLCIVKRQKTMAAQVAAPKPAACSRLGYYGQNTGSRTSTSSSTTCCYSSSNCSTSTSRQEEEAAAQPRYHSLAQEQATAQQKAQLTPSSKKKDR